MIISIILFVAIGGVMIGAGVHFIPVGGAPALLFIRTIIVKLMQKNDTQGKLKRFNEIIEMALIVQFLIIVNDIFSVL